MNIKHGCRSLKIIGEGWQRISEKREGTASKYVGSPKCPVTSHHNITHTYVEKIKFFIEVQNTIFACSLFFPGTRGSRKITRRLHPKLNTSIDSRRKLSISTPCIASQIVFEFLTLQNCENLSATLFLLSKQNTN